MIFVNFIIIKYKKNYIIDDLLQPITSAIYSTNGRANYSANYSANYRTNYFLNCHTNYYTCTLQITVKIAQRFTLKIKDISFGIFIFR